MPQADDNGDDCEEAVFCELHLLHLAQFWLAVVPPDGWLRISRASKRFRAQIVEQKQALLSALPCSWLDGSGILLAPEPDMLMARFWVLAQTWTQAQLTPFAERLAVPEGLVDSFVLPTYTSPKHEAVVESLHRLGEDARPYFDAFGVLLGHRSICTRRAALIMLGKLGAPSTVFAPEIVAMLADEDCGIRNSSVSVLTSLGEHLAENTLQQVLDIVRHPRFTARAAGARVLGRLHWLAKDCLGELGKLLNDEFQEVRANAAEALGEFGECATPYVAALAQRLADEDEEVRYEALEAFAKLSEYATPFAGDICACLDDEFWGARCAALSALGQFGQSSAPYIHDIARKLKDEHPSVRRMAAVSLGELSEHASPCFQDLLSSLQDDDDAVVKAVSASLQRMGDKVEGLKDLLQRYTTTLLALQNVQRLHAAAVLSASRDAGR